MLGITAILAAATVLVSAVPAWAARVAQGGDLWNLPRLLPASAPGVSSRILPLLLASVVVLAVVCSHWGHHHQDHW